MLRFGDAYSPTLKKSGTFFLTVARRLPLSRAHSIVKQACATASSAASTHA
jgi:hypothetical protein